MRVIAKEHGERFPIQWRNYTRCPLAVTNVVLQFQKNEGIVVDTHVIRLSQRLGLTKHKDAEKIRADLMKLVPRENGADWSHWLIWHGRRRC